jgi:hypothetical protein
MIYSLLQVVQVIVVVPLVVVVSRSDNVTEQPVFWILLVLTCLLIWGVFLVRNFTGALEAVLVRQHVAGRFPHLDQMIAAHRLWIRLLLWLSRLYDGFYTIIYTYVFPVALAIVGVLLFVTPVYVHLPQEFGGARARCAEIDLKREDLSPKTMAALVGSSVAFMPGKVARTVAPKVHFAGTNFLLVSSRREGEAKQGLYEIQRSTVTTINWCPGA